MSKATNPTVADAPTAWAAPTAADQAVIESNAIEAEARSADAVAQSKADKAEARAQAVVRMIAYCTGVNGKSNKKGKTLEEVFSDPILEAYIKSGRANDELPKIIADELNVRSMRKFFTYSRDAAGRVVSAVLALFRIVGRPE
jgi:hypothetical protein